MQNLEFFKTNTYTYKILFHYVTLITHIEHTPKNIYCNIIIETIAICDSMSFYDYDMITPVISVKGFKVLVNGNLLLNTSLSLFNDNSSFTYIMTLVTTLIAI